MVHSRARNSPPNIRIAVSKVDWKAPAEPTITPAVKTKNPKGKKPAARKAKQKAKKALKALLDRKEPSVRTLIKECVAEAAREFNDGRSNPLVVLEHDWMNSAADVALPWYLE